MLNVTEVIGVPDGIRTRVIAVKGRCPRPLDDGDAMAEGSPTLHTLNYKATQVPMGCQSWIALRAKAFLKAVIPALPSPWDRERRMCNAIASAVEGFKKVQIPMICLPEIED